MYLPSDDSIFLANNVSHYHGNLALEIGTGSGIVLRELSNNFTTVVGTDVDFGSLKYAHILSRNALLICCDSTSPFQNIKFDLIVFNPPYLPNVVGCVDKTIDGGPSGFENTIHFLTYVLDKLSTEGKILVLVSSISENGKLSSFVSKNNLIIKRIAQKKLFYETLQIIELSK